MRAAFSARLTRTDARQQIIKAFLNQPGLPAKVAQIMAMKSGVDAQQSTMPQMTLAEVRNRIEERQPTLAAEMRSISEESYAASLSQVHSAVLKSGEKIAIKIQFPGLAREIHGQIDDFIALAAKSPARAFGFSPESWSHFFKKKILDELDYTKEADNQEAFFRQCDPMKIVVPEVLRKYSCSQILVQSWEYSRPAAEVMGQMDDYPSDFEKQAASRFLELLMLGLFDLRIIHGDLNPGNYGLRIEGTSRNLKLVLYDFGAVEDMQTPRIDSLARLIARSRGMITDDWMDLLAQIGFDTGKLEPLTDKIDPVMMALLEPFAIPGSWNPQEWHPGRQLDEIVGSEKWWLRTAGPPWFLYLMRFIHGWHHGLKMIGTQVAIGDAVMERVKPYLAESGSGTSDTKRPGSTSSKIAEHGPMTARFLNVLVTEKSEVIVQVELPAAAVENLADLVPETVGEKVAARGINLQVLGRQLAEKGAPRGPVFELEETGRNYRVWLE